VAACATATAVAHSAAGLGDDFQVVRDRLLNATWATARIPPQDALGFAAALNGSCFWPDINYEDENRAMWDTVIHLSPRTTALIAAVTDPSSSLYGNATVLRKAICALNVWLVYQFQNPNWWYAAIGAYMRVNDYQSADAFDRLTRD
jgi:hypothetical protein